MVFHNDKWNATGEIVVYSNYHKYWLDRERGIKNPLFDVYSGKILDLKEGHKSAVQYFYNLIDPEICKGIAICVVPSSNSHQRDSGIAQLGLKLAQNGRKDYVHYLNRVRSIEKLSHGADHVEMFALGKAI